MSDHGPVVVSSRPQRRYQFPMSSRQKPISKPGRGLQGRALLTDKKAPAPFAPFLSIPILPDERQEGGVIDLNLRGARQSPPPPEKMIETLSRSTHGAHASSPSDNNGMLSGELAGLTDLPGTRGKNWESKFKGFLESAAIIEPKPAITSNGGPAVTTAATMSSSYDH